MSSSQTRKVATADFSDSSEKPLHDAVSIARRYGARFYLVLLGGPTLNDMCIEFKVIGGPVADTILEVAAEKRCDLIIMGLKSAATLMNHLIWSHAYEIVREAC